jgi:hypothetical protein
MAFLPPKKDSQYLIALTVFFFPYSIFEVSSRQFSALFYSAYAVAPVASK